MGYQVVKRYKRPDGSYSWRILHENYVDKKRTQRHVAKDKWRAIGFSPSMSFEEAKERAKQLSAQDWVKFQERRRNAINERLAKEEKIECAWLPPLLCELFENEVLREKVACVAPFPSEPAKPGPGAAGTLATEAPWRR